MLQDNREYYLNLLVPIVLAGILLILAFVDIKDILDVRESRENQESQKYDINDECPFISRLPTHILKCYSNGTLIYDEWVVRNGEVLCTPTGNKITLHELQCIEQEVRNANQVEQ